jgi:hypothetical protein
LSPHLRLCLAIVIQAMKDVQRQPGDENLIAWLLKDGFFILEVCEIQISWEKWRAFVLAGCPGVIAKSRN